jgi:hypothetical protein
MKRHYYISDNLDDLELVEHELESEGLSDEQIHVLSNNEAALASHHLHPVVDFMKTDVIRSGLVGASIGAMAATLVLAVTAVMGWAEAIGWTPFVFLAVVALGFCTWEGGFMGFQEKNRRFRRFDEVVKANKHVLFVDVTAQQEGILSRITSRHPRLQLAGDGPAMPEWLIAGQRQVKNFVHWAP